MDLENNKAQMRKGYWNIASCRFFPGIPVMQAT